MQPALKVELRHLPDTTLQPEPAGRQATAVHSGKPPALNVSCGMLHMGTGQWQGKMDCPLCQHGCQASPRFYAASDCTPSGSKGYGSATHVAQALWTH